MVDDQESQAWRNAFRLVLYRMRPVERAVILTAIGERDRAFSNDLRDEIRADALLAMAERSSRTSISAKAKWVADDLAAYSASAWLNDRDVGLPETASELRQFRFEALSSNGGVPLGWRRILEIIDEK